MKNNSYSNKELKDLVISINKLSKNEHIEIYKLLKNFSKQFTENSNGIFINLSILDDNIIKDLIKFVSFRIGSNNYLNKLEENRKKSELILNNKKKVMNKEIEEKDGDVENDDNNGDNNNDNKDLDKNQKKELETSDKKEKNDENQIIENKINNNHKFILKKKKEKFSGMKAKILKNYKSKQQIQIKKKSSKKKKSKDIDVEIDDKKEVDDYNLDEYNSENE